MQMRIDSKAKWAWEALGGKVWY